MSSERISPTAYATGYFWYKHGLSHAALATPKGKRLDRPFGLLMKLLGGEVFQNLMLARHTAIDALLARAIDDGRVTQVIEIAAGLSGRGVRMTQKYGERLTYLETDLPQMAALKRKLLADAGLLGPRHQVLTLDALADGGPDSLAQVAGRLDPKQGLAIITEGLMNYLDPVAAQGVWARIARTLAGFPQGLYLADVYFMQQHRGLAARVFGGVIQAFVRGRMHIHFESAGHGIGLMQAAGFSRAAIHEIRELPETRRIGSQPGGDRVRALEAWR
ncbi:MAG TPA: class I SAM-dependent methyltransferase [Nevskiales bacterium]|nr:class I SAM-dependent methyltransferase [Nevskiales bacterium]